jgi:hypothetical protein
MNPLRGADSEEYPI